MTFFYHLFSLIAKLRTYIEIKTFQKRFYFLKKTGKKFYNHHNDEKILIVIPHVVANASTASQEKLDRLIACLDSLQKTFFSYHTKIVLISKEGFSMHEKLPRYLKDKIEVVYSSQPDPMFVEYDAYEIFKEHINAYDFYVFLEDDILLNDSWFIEKIKKFNQLSPFNKYVLLPHRFEFYNGIKYYIDQFAVRGEEKTNFSYSQFLNVNLEDVSFCIYENPHAAFYCLNQSQMQKWIDSGYRWKNEVVAFGVLESAATFSMYENFEFIKPHPDYVNYLEVQHYGNKYMLNDKIALENV